MPASHTGGPGIESHLSFRTSFLQIIWEAADYGPSSWVPDNCVKDPGRAPGFGTGPVPTAAGIWGMKQQMENLCLSQLLCLSNQSINLI